MISENAGSAGGRSVATGADLTNIGSPYVATLAGQTSQTKLSKPSGNFTPPACT